MHLCNKTHREQKVQSKGRRRDKDKFAHERIHGLEGKNGLHKLDQSC